MNAQALPPGDEAVTPSRDESAHTGATLRKAREARGLSVADVAQALKLTQRQVEAMENERFEQLPGEAFARGFLRNYCRFLELDSEPLLRAVEGKGVAGGVSVNLIPVSNAEGTLPASDLGRRSVFGPLIALGLIVVLVVALGWYFDWFHRTPAVDSTAETGPASTTPAAVTSPQVPAPAPAVPQQGSGAETASPAPAPADAAAPAPAASPADATPAVAMPATALPGTTVAAAPETSTPAEPPVPAGSSRLSFSFEQAAWVEVRDAAGTQLLGKVNPANSTQDVVGKGPFRLIIGNASHVKLVQDGKAVDLAPHMRGTVARLTLK